MRSEIVPGFIITEDSNSGYDFFAKLAEQKNIKCISASGKSNVIKKLQDSENVTETRLVIVDGAAFGSEMKDVDEYLKVYENVVLYAPESFEWLLLSSAVIPNAKVEEILQKPEDYIDCKEYVSWERFFTAVLTEKTQNSLVWAYSKKKLPKAYLAPKVIGAMKKLMKLVIWE